MARRTGEAALPTAARTTTRRLDGFSGLDLRGGEREGCLSESENIDPRALPRVETLPGLEQIVTGLPGTMRSLHAIGGALFIVYENGEYAYLCRRTADGVQTSAIISQGQLGPARSILPYNLYNDPQDPLGSYQQMALILPDRYWFEPQGDITPFLLQKGSAWPAIQQGCVHLSRLFGVEGDRIYACAYNDPRDWDLDTASDIGAANAWASTVQSNTRSAGDFTATCVYDGHVLAFKRSFCHIVNNNKNPFRVADLLSVGCVDGRTLAEVDGMLFFVGEDGVYRYNGDSATRVSDPLGEQDYTGALGAGTGGIYYLYLPAAGRVFLYAEQSGAWSSLPTLPRSIVSMTADSSRCYLLDEGGVIYATGSGTGGHFALQTTPLLSDVAGGVCRLSVAITAGQGCTYRLVWQDTQGRQRTLLSGTGNGRTQRVRSRVFTPTDYGGSLLLSGEGDMMLHDLALTTVGQSDIPSKEEKG